MADEREILVPEGGEDLPPAIIRKEALNPELTGMRYAAYTTSGERITAETALHDSDSSRESALLAVCLEVIEAGYNPVLPLPGEYWTYDGVRVAPQGGK